MFAPISLLSRCFVLFVFSGGGKRGRSFIQPSLYCHDQSDSALRWQRCEPFSVPASLPPPPPGKFQQSSLFVAVWRHNEPNLASPGNLRYTDILRQKHSQKLKQIFRRALLINVRLRQPCCRHTTGNAVHIQVLCSHLLPINSQLCRSPRQRTFPNRRFF